MGYSDNVVFLGTELKLSINIGGSEKDSPIPNMGEFSFKVEVFCTSKNTLKAKYNYKEGFEITDSVSNDIDIIYSYKKNSSDEIDPNSFILLINTEKLGTGSVKCKVTAYLLDEDFKKTDDNYTGTLDNNYRTEVSIVDTGITIEKSI